MKPVRFSYKRPASMSEALALLDEHGSDAAILAGGQSLMPMLNLRFARPSVLVDIKRIPGLSGITAEDGAIVVGALARHVEVATSPAVREHAPLIHQAMSHVAHAAVRNRGTFGGSLALADPAAEMPACCVCLDAGITLASSAGERIVPASDFFRGIYETAIEPGEMIVSVSIHRRDKGWRWVFDEASRRHGDFAIAGVALGMRMESGDIAECRLAFNGVETFPRRLTDIERRLTGLNIKDDIAAVARQLGDVLEPMESDEYPGAYRIAVATTLMQRALARAMS